MRLSRFLAVTAAVFSLSTAANALPSDPAPIAEGFDYVRLAAPQPVATGTKIEVVEVFWYQCPHCWQLEPELNSWTKKLPSDVQLRLLPAALSERWLPASKLYFTMDALNLLGRLHGKVFDAYHVERVDLNDPAVAGAWFEKQGVPRKKFEQTLKSFGVTAKAAQAQKQVEKYDLNGVPALVIDGKYVTSPSMTGGRARMFEVVDQLIAKARAERKAVLRK